MDSDPHGIYGINHIENDVFEELDNPAVLTQKQRDYLGGDSDIDSKSPAERAVRSRIRKRLSHSVSDFALLHGNIEQRDLRTAFSDVAPALDDTVEGVIDDPDQVELQPRGIAALSTMLEGLTESIVDDADFDSTDKRLLYILEIWMEAALTAMYEQQGNAVADIDVSLNVDFHPPIEELKERPPDDVSLPQYQRLLRAGEITQDEFYQFVTRLYDVNRIVEEPPEK